MPKTDMMETSKTLQRTGNRARELTSNMNSKEKMEWPNSLRSLNGILCFIVTSLQRRATSAAPYLSFTESTCSACPYPSQMAPQGELMYISIDTVAKGERRDWVSGALG